jgi:formylglycine-generating enzyme required for sulfatase activity
MKRKLYLLVPILFLFGCGGDKNTKPLSDTTPPATVRDLAVAPLGASSVRLTWTAPGDDAGSGTATQYDIRYSITRIEGDAWGNATSVGSPAPHIIGTGESFTVTDLSGSDTLHFALRAADEIPNWSPWSNVASGRLDGVAPAAVTDLALAFAADTSITLCWTATGDDGRAGQAFQYDLRFATNPSWTWEEMMQVAILPKPRTAAAYDIRYSTTLLTEAVWASANQAAGDPAPHQAGTIENFTVGGLNSGTVFYFAVKASDDAGNQSALSSVVVAATPVAPPGPPPGMVLIPAGFVRLGQTGLAAPVHNIYIEGFYVDIYEVSNAKYKAFIDAAGYTTAAYWNPVGWAWRVANGITLPAYWNETTYHGGGIAGNERFPANGVSWWEADAYCRWAGGRLPTEAEWEKAAKGGCETHGDAAQCDASDTPSYPWGQDISAPRANNLDSGDPYENNGWTTPVGYYDGGTHGGFQTIDSPGPYGLYDSAGNVYEWCSTKWGYSYPYNPNDGRENPPASYNERDRVLRGGAWGVEHYGSYFLGCAYRASGNVPSLRDRMVGFRCVRTGS